MANKKEAGTDRQAVEYGDQRVERGYGGEIHQVASGDSPRLTTQQGIVVSDDQNTLLAAPGQHRRKGGRRARLTGGARDRTDLARARGPGACHSGSARGVPTIV